MTYRKSMLSASIIAALMFTGAAIAHDNPASKADAPAGQAQATQDQSQNNRNTPNEKNAQNLKSVVVVGIRASMQQSLQTKRNADAIVDAVTAEDLGKFPNANAAESLSLTPGVQVDRQFGQGQRVTIDGIDSTLNLTLLDNHPVAQTSWRYFSAPQRGFNYLMIAPEMLGRLEVFKSQQAKLPSGSIGGTVIMHTRKPLDMRANAIAGSVRYNYNDQASDGKPSASLLYNWKNQDSTFGFNVALQHYEESIDRQGLEIFGYNPISDYVAAGNTAAAAGVANGSLRPDDMVPQEVNSAWFQQHLKRDSALVNVQFAPTEQFGGNLSLLYIKERFTNYNQSVYGYTSQNLLSADSFTRSADGVITDGHVTPPVGSNQGVIYDNQLRPSNITTKGADLKLHYNADTWGLEGAIGLSKAENPDSGQMFIEPVYQGPGQGAQPGAWSWNIHTGLAPDDKAAYADPANWGAKGVWFGNYNIFGSWQKDKYGSLDFHKYFNGVINTIEIGVRYADAKTRYNARAYGGVAADTLAGVGTDGISDLLGALPQVGYGSAHHPVVGADNVEDWVLGSPDLDYPSAGSRGDNPAFYSQYTWRYDQETTAAYIQADYATDVLRGNFGVRWVRTKNTGYGYNVPTGTTVTWDNLASFWVQKSGTTNEFLPSFTIIYDNGGDVVLRGSMAKVMAWAPYNAMAYQVGLNDDTYRGTIGNPGLGPYTAYNTDVSVEWYFAPQAVFAVSGFYKNITNYITQKEVMSRQFNNIFNADNDRYMSQLLGHHGCDSTGYCDYKVKKFVGGSSAHVKGFTLTYQQSFDNGFGLAANYTYATGKTDLGTDLSFLSRHSLSVSPYFERGPFSARLNLNTRSKYHGIGYVAGAATPITDAFTTISASLGWAFNKHWSLSLDGSNLTNEKYYQYKYGVGGQALPLNKYTTGRRYSLGMHFKF